MHSDVWPDPGGAFGFTYLCQRSSSITKFPTRLDRLSTKISVWKVKIFTMGSDRKSKEKSSKKRSSYSSGSEGTYNKILLTQFFFWVFFSNTFWATNQKYWVGFCLKFCFLVIGFLLQLPFLLLESTDEGKGKRQRREEDEERKSRKSDRKEKKKEKESHKHSKRHSDKGLNFRFQ